MAQSFGQSPTTRRLFGMIGASMCQNDQAMTTRLATPADAAAMAGIYRPYVEDAAVTFELVAPSEGEFARRIAHTLEKHPWLVAERDGEVIAVSECN